MKATEQYFRVVLFIMLYKVVRTFRQGMESLSVIIQTKPFLKYFHTVPFAFQHFTK